MSHIFATRLRASDWIELKMDPKRIRGKYKAGQNARGGNGISLQVVPISMHVTKRAIRKGISNLTFGTHVAVSFSIPSASRRLVAVYKTIL
jgi:hypothetical protein